MTASGTARLLTVLVLCTRMVAIAVAVAILVWVVRGEPVPVERLLEIPRTIGDVISATSLTSAPGAGASTAETEPVDRAQLRHQLQELFAHHATLAVRFMRSTVSEDPDLVDAADAVLVRNTDELEAALGQSIDADQAAAFAVGWAASTQVLFRYAAAVRDDDSAAQDEARALLSTSITDQAALLADATGGNVDHDMAATSLRMQVDLLLFQIDAYARGDYGQAYELEREAYAHIFPFAASVANGVTGHPRGTIQATPDEELTADLSRLLGAHVELSVDAQRAGVAPSVVSAPSTSDDAERPGARTSAEAGAAMAALDANSQELLDTFDGFLDPRSSKRFAALWADHVDLPMRYAVAVAEHQPSKQRKLRDRLDTLATRIGRIVHKATRGHADASAVADALRSQQTLLLGQIEAYVASDHARAQDVSYRAHQRTHDLAGMLSTAFIAAAHDDAPRGGADTGGGGTDDSTGGGGTDGGGTDGGGATDDGTAQQVGASVRHFASARTHQPAPAPAHIEIPAIEVRSDLVRLDRAADGTIAPPPRWQTAGWYRHSAKPGQRGAAVILGHVDSTTGPAVFYRLRQLRIGDEIRVVRDDGSTVRFAVRRTAHYAKTQFPTADVYLPTPEPTLRLVTCAGAFDRAAASYRENLVVFADMIE